jgi:hypothetical protein
MAKATALAKRFLRHPVSGRGKRVVRFIAAVALALFVATPVWLQLVARAIVEQPDSPPTISQIHINRNCIQTGDMFVYFRYKLPYATAPDLTANYAFIFRVMDQYGETDYGYSLPYPYAASSHNATSNGYNDGITGLYFPASANMTWGTTYKLRVSENPAAFAIPVDFDFNIAAFTSLTSQADNQAEIATNLYYMALPFESIFGQDLFQTAGSQQVLTERGENYFRGAITGLQAIAPPLFLIQEAPLEDEAHQWTTAQFDTYEHRFDNTWVGDAMNASAAQIGAPDASVGMALGVILPLCLLAIIFSSMKMRTAIPGYVCVAVLLLMGVLMGWIPKAVFASAYQACGVYSAYLVFYARG